MNEQPEAEPLINILEPSRLPGRHHDLLKFAFVLMNLGTMKRSSPILLSFLLAVLPASSFAAGNVYKWVDDNGVVHYTDQKPSERESEKLGIKTSPGAAPSSSPDDPDVAVDNLKRQQEIQDLGKRQAAEEEKEKQQKKELCENARKNLEVIQNNARIKMDDNGRQRYLTPEEIIQKREGFEKQMKENCQ